MKNEDLIRSVVCLLAIDGEMDQQERQFLQALSTRLRVSKEVVNEALNQVRQGKGRVHVSNDLADKVLILDTLTQAALANGAIAPRERQVLNTVAAKIGFSEADVAKLIQRHEKPATLTCPKCGVEQDSGRTECLRCGIIFAKIASKGTERSEDLSLSPFPEDVDEEVAYSNQLERFKEASFRTRQVLFGSLFLFVALIILLFGFGNRRDLSVYAIMSLIIAGIGGAILGKLILLNRFGVVTTGEVLDKRMWKSRDRHHQQTHYLIQCEFEVVRSGMLSKPISVRIQINEFHYKRLGIGSSVKIRYLPTFPRFCQVELW
jgi:DnaJ-domain-containing protein 1